MISEIIMYAQNFFLCSVKKWYVEIHRHIFLIIMIYETSLTRITYFLINNIFFERENANVNIIIVRLQKHWCDNLNAIKSIDKNWKKKVDKQYQKEKKET